MATDSTSDRASVPTSSTAKTSANASNMVQTTKNDCHLLRLPAELRNEIFLLVLGAGELVNVTATRWPGITGTCRKIRAETLPVYLGSENLVAQVDGLRDGPLLRWLSKISKLALKEKQSIRTVTIACTGDILDMEPGYDNSGDTPLRFEPNFDFWDNVVCQIHATGLAATQVRWAGTDVERLGLEDYGSGTDKAEVILFHNFVLEPLLQAYELDDNGCVPVDVAGQTAKPTSSLWSQREPIAWATQWAVGDPEDWYFDW